MNVNYLYLGTCALAFGVGVACIHPATRQWVFHKVLSATEYYLRAKRYLGLEPAAKVVIVSPQVRRRLLADIKDL